MLPLPAPLQVSLLVLTGLKFCDTEKTVSPILMWGRLPSPFSVVIEDLVCNFQIWNSIAEIVAFLSGKSESG